jgi:hypothetical protein
MRRSSLSRLPEIARWGRPLLASVVLALAAAPGCGTVLIGDAVTMRGDGWTLVLDRFADGPNQVTVTGYTQYEPERGQRFLHAYLRFRNDGPAPRMYGYDACDLDLDGGNTVLPSLVTRYNGVASVMDRNETYAPAEESARHLTFAYPEGKLPTRLRCATITFPIPRAAGQTAAR